MHLKKRLVPWKIGGYASARSRSFLEFPSRIELLRVRSHERQNEIIPVWLLKMAWKQVLFTWSFTSTAFQNDPIFWWTCVSISFRVVFTCYFITQNEISFLSKWPMWNPYPHCVSTQYPTSLCLFISFRVNCVHRKISSRFEISFRSKWPIWNSYRFEFHFTLIHVNTSKELTEHWVEIFNRNEISYWFEFISPLVWTYSYNAVEKTRISSSRVFKKLLLSWLAQSLWNIFDIWLIYI